MKNKKVSNGIFKGAAAFIFISALTLSFLLNFSAVAYASDETPDNNAGANFEITQREFKDVKKDMIITGVLPVFSSDDSAASDYINGLVADAYDSMLSRAGESKDKLYFAYERFIYGDCVSILMRCGSPPGNGQFDPDIVQSVNFSASTLKSVDINGVLGVNGVKLIDKALMDAIKQNVDEYVTNFSTIGDGRSFYVDNGVLYAAFDRYEITLGSAGVYYFPVTIDKIRELTVSADSYIIKAGYNVKMVRLKDIAQAFGYDATWSEKDQTIGIYSADGQFLTGFTIGKNSYTKVKATAQYVLEAAPEIIGDRTYVPASFFDRALGISYTSNADGSITFSKLDTGGY